jgi:hypothetical protein
MQQLPNKDALRGSDRPSTGHAGLRFELSRHERPPQSFPGPGEVPPRDARGRLCEGSERLLGFRPMTWP